ncbi:MAG: hypothetical protein IJK42_05230 [Prevotella sp.]|nr:hypothetical protein [Prevotella sp.]
MEQVVVPLLLTTSTDFGYVFDGCKVVDLAEGKGDWNFGRTWQNYPICIYLNTTLDDYSAKTLVGSRWTQKGMNNRDPKVFGEFNTMDEAGNNITPASNVITSFGGQFQTILSADEADAYSYDKMFTDWDPAVQTIQVEAPTDATFDNGVVTWTPMNNGAIAYALFKNGEFLGLSFDSMFETDATDNDKLTIRAANPMGGFGPAAEVAFGKVGEDGGFVDGINVVGETQIASDIYNMQGIRLQKADRGLFIVNGKKVVK